MIWLAFAVQLMACQPDARRMTDLRWTDLEGNLHSIHSLQSRKGIVLFFLSTDCPVSNAYAPEYRRLASSYPSISFFGIYPDPEITTAEASKHAKDYRMEFPLVLDLSQKMAQAAGVRVTPEAVLMKPNGEIAYVGRLDDRYTLQGKRRDEPKSRELENAIKDLLEGKTPRVAHAPAYGCPLPRPGTKKDKNS